ncbi:hypothetical protein C1N81_10720 [Streptomyces sp. SGAir0957]
MRTPGGVGGCVSGPCQWFPCALAEAPPNSRATARKGSVTTVAMAPPIERSTSAMALSMTVSSPGAEPGGARGSVPSGRSLHWVS